MPDALAGLSPHDLRLIHKELTRTKKSSMMEDEEVYRNLKAMFPEQTLRSTVARLRRELKLESSQISKQEVEDEVFDTLINSAFPESSASVVTELPPSANSEGVIQVRKWAERQVTILQKQIESNAATVQNAVKVALDAETAVQDVIEQVRQTQETQNKLISAKLDSVSNTLAGYLSHNDGGTKLPPLQVVINMPSGEQNVLEGEHTHIMFEKSLRLLQAGMNLAFVGPGGSGKSTLNRQLAKALGVPYAYTPLSGGISESALTVKMQPLGPGGAMRPVASQFAARYGGLENYIAEDGLTRIRYNPEMAGLTCLEEADAADPNTLLVLNNAIENGMMVIEPLVTIGMSPFVEQHPNNYITANMNTFGTGMDMQYAGRNALDAAFMDRFYFVYIDYDPVLESKIANLPIKIGNQVTWVAAAPPSDDEWRELSRWVLETRAKMAKLGVKKLWGTRTLLRAKKARYAGIPTEEVKRDLLLGLHQDLVSSLI